MRSLLDHAGVNMRLQRRAAGGELQIGGLAEAGDLAVACHKPDCDGACFQLRSKTFYGVHIAGSATSHSLINAAGGHQDCRGMAAVRCANNDEAAVVKRDFGGTPPAKHLVAVAVLSAAASLQQRLGSSALQGGLPPRRQLALQVPRRVAPAARQPPHRREVQLPIRHQRHVCGGRASAVSLQNHPGASQRWVAHDSAQCAVKGDAAIGGWQLSVNLRHRF